MEVFAKIFRKLGKFIIKINEKWFKKLFENT